MICQSCGAESDSPAPEESPPIRNYVALEGAVAKEVYHESEYPVILAETQQRWSVSGVTSRVSVVAFRSPLTQDTKIRVYESE